MTDVYYSHDDANLQALIAACDEALNWADANARWFDISTAPRDGRFIVKGGYRVTEIDGHTYELNTESVMVSPSNGELFPICDSECYQPFIAKPTHWMPIQNPPPPSNPPLPAPIERLGEVLRKVKNV